MPSFAKIYFILGFAMLLVVLWDYNKLPATAKRLAKQAPKTQSQFSRIALDVRNLTVMALFVLFLWPLALLMELFGSRKE